MSLSLQLAVCCAVCLAVGLLMIIPFHDALGGYSGLGGWAVIAGIVLAVVSNYQYRRERRGRRAVPGP